MRSFQCRGCVLQDAQCRGNLELELELELERELVEKTRAKPVEAPVQFKYAHITHEIKRYLSQLAEERNEAMRVVLTLGLMTFLYASEVRWFIRSNERFRLTCVVKAHEFRTNPNCAIMYDMLDKVITEFTNMP